MYTVYVEEFIGEDDVKTFDSEFEDMDEALQYARVSNEQCMDENIRFGCVPQEIWQYWKTHKKVHDKQ